jgi:hypothetical protein
MSECPSMDAYVSRWCCVAHSWRVMSGWPVPTKRCCRYSKLFERLTFTLKRSTPDWRGAETARRGAKAL